MPDPDPDPTSVFPFDDASGETDETQLFLVGTDALAGLFDAVESDFLLADSGMAGCFFSFG